MDMAQLQGPRDPSRAVAGWMKFPKRGFQSLGVTFPPLPLRLGCGHKSTRTPELDAGERTLWELKQIYGNSHTCGFEWHLLNEDPASILGTARLVLPAPPNPQKGVSGMLFVRGIWTERRSSHTANAICIFSSPCTRFKEPQVQTSFFYPLVKVEFVHAVSEDGAMISRSMKDTWYISVTYRSTAAPYVMGHWGDGLSPKWCFWQCYLVRYYSNLGVQIQLEHIAVYSSQAACSSRQNWEYSQWDSPESTFIC